MEALTTEGGDVAFALSPDAVDNLPLNIETARSAESSGRSCQIRDPSPDADPHVKSRM